jgi:predicted secreted protein
MTTPNADARARKVAFVSHCVLNQNAKVGGIAQYPAAIRPVVDLLLQHDVGIYQMPCPEMLYLGAMRWSQVRDQYNSPMFRRHVLGLATQVLDQAEDYRRSGYQVIGFIMIDGSPVCGYRKTPQPAEPGQVLGGMVRYLPETALSDGPGVYCETLLAEAARRGMGDVPFVSLPEVPGVGPMAEALAAIERVLRGAP